MDSILRITRAFLNLPVVLYTLLRMKRLGILLLLAVTAVTTSPAMAFALADHSCCATSPAADPHKEASSNSKHAHCAGMAAQSAKAQSARHGVTGLHNCKACGLSALMSPRNAMTAVTRHQIGEVSKFAAARVLAPHFISNEVAARDVRGPPPSLLA